MSLPGFEASLLDAVGEAVIATRADGTVIYWNRAAEALYGWTREEVLGGNIVDFTPSELSRQQAQELMSRLSKGEPWAGEFNVRRKDGSTFWAQVTNTPVVDAHGTLTSIIGVSRDLTETRQIQQVLADEQRGLERRLMQQGTLQSLTAMALRGASVEGLIREATAALVLTLEMELCEILQRRPDGRWAQVSIFGCEPTGIEEAVVEGAEAALAVRTVESGNAVQVDDWQTEARIARSPLLQRGGIQSSLSVPLNLRSGTYGVLAVHSRRSHAFTREERQMGMSVAGLLVVALQREEDERKARQCNLLLRQILEHVPEGVTVFDASLRIRLANSRFCATLGREPARVEGGTLDELIDPAVLPRVRERLEACFRTGHANPPTEYRFRSAPGRTFEGQSVPFEFEGERAVLGVLRDVTDARQMEARMMMSDRLVSVGTLAAGVAHELNNPLAYVISNLRYIAEELSTELPSELAERFTDMRTAVDEAMQGAERMRVIVRDMRSFSRSGDESRSPTDLQPLLESAIRMTWNEFRHRAQLIRHFGPVPQVLANESRLGQVLVNLLVNAAQAIQEDDPVRHRIEVSLGTTPDGRAKIAIRDTGCGISAENLKRVFDPFFTTKPIGVGTGLGLAVCHNIIDKHGGTIDVASAPGEGSTFTILLPAFVAKTEVLAATPG